jgi:ferrous iron transport protein B
MESVLSARERRGKVNVENSHTVALVGNPNVGKSVIFNALTGARAAVSNYPGTTVSVSSGTVRIGELTIELIDTPGMYSLLPISEEEQVARTLLFESRPRVAVNVMDARNIERMLPFTFQLIESGLDLILVLNMMDEAESAGLRIDHRVLTERLGVEAIPAVAVTGKGINELKEAIYERFDSDSNLADVS